jgi:hypothetical protein
MPSGSTKLRGIFVPPEQVEVYLANGWTVVDDLNPHHVLILPPSLTPHRQHDRDRAEGRAHDT